MWVDIGLGALLAVAWMAGGGRNTATLGAIAAVMVWRLMPGSYGLLVGAIVMIVGSALSTTRRGRP